MGEKARVKSPTCRSRRRLVRIPAQTAVVGSDQHYPEEGPAHAVSVDEFWIQTRQVTNAEFAEFVDATGYVTVAERPLDPADYPDAPAENLQPGSMVFHRTQGPVDLRHINQWWAWTPGACWHHPRRAAFVDRGTRRPPRGPRRLRGRRGVCEWAGLRAADRGGMGGRGPRRPRRRGVHLGRRARAARSAAGQLLARRLPVAARSRLRHAPRPSAVSRPTTTAFSTWRATSGSGPPTGTAARPARREPCCDAGSYDPRQPQFRVPRKVIKGGSFLCADNYCLRYRPAARRPQMVDTGHEPYRFSLHNAHTTHH